MTVEDNNNSSISSSSSHVDSANAGTNAGGNCETAPAFDQMPRLNGNEGVEMPIASMHNMTAASQNAPNPDSSTNSGSSSRGPTQMRRRVTMHRQTLERIHKDSNEQTRHSVPDPRTRTSSYESSSFAPRTEGFNSSGSDDSGNGNGDDDDCRKGPEGWVEKHSRNLRASLQRRSLEDWVQTFIPMYKWLRVYDFGQNLFQDVLAGLTVGVMVVPQSMSYAKLAGLPVEYGLYSALVPVYAYAMFGSSRQLAVGPVALVSLLLSTGLEIVMDNQGITRENTPNYDAIYIQMAVQTSFLVGVCYIIMGMLRLGFITIFLSHAVISGFTTGAAVIIGMSQIKYLFGYDIPNEKALHRIISNIIKDIDKFNYKTFLVGTSSVFALVGLKHLGKTYPKLKFLRAMGPLMVTVISIAVQAIFDIESQGVPIVKTIPKGFPAITVDELLPIDKFNDLVFVVLSIVIVGFMESIAIAKQLASKHKYEVDSSMELIGLGMANLGAGFFQGYPVTGSFSRSAVNNDTGAKSGISAIVTASLVGLVLLFLTTVFELLPLSVLASIVISGVIGLLDYPEAIYLWKVHKFDFSVWVFAFLGTLFLGVELGLTIAVSISLTIVLFESAYPHTAVLGRLPGTMIYRNIKQYPEAECYDGIVMVRIDAPIYFANTQNVREKISKYEQRAEEQLAVRSEKVQFIILEMSPVSHVDTSALHILHDMAETYRDRDIQLCLANPSRMVMDKLSSSGVADDIGRDNIFVSIRDAVDQCLRQMDSIEMSKHDQDTDTTDPLQQDVDCCDSSEINGDGGHDDTDVQRSTKDIEAQVQQ